MLPWTHTVWTYRILCYTTFAPTIDTTQDSFSRRVSHYSCCVCLLSFTDSPLHAHISILRGLYPTMLLWCYRFYLLYGPYRTQRHCMFLNALGLLNLFERLRNLLFAHLSRILWTSFPAFAPGSLECVIEYKIVLLLPVPRVKFVRWNCQRIGSTTGSSAS